MKVQMIRSIVRRFLLASLMVMVIVSVANAYTIVMKGGRRVEIPSKFTVAQATLTYEVQPGIQVTLQLAAIDVAATERANNEQPGALRGRSQSLNVPVVTPDSTAGTAARTITNRDLESSAHRRIASEVSYDKRMKELGLPSAAESRRRSEETTAIAQEELHERLASEKEAEEYWRGRAATFRTDAVALDAEIEFVRNRLAQLPPENGNGTGYLGEGYSYGNPYPYGVGNGGYGIGNGGYGVGNGGYGVGNGGYGGPYGRDRYFPGARRNGAQVYSAPGAVNQRGYGREGYGGNRSRINRGRGYYGNGGYGGYGNIGLGNVIGVVAPTTVYGSGPTYDSTYERSELISRFNQLSAARAGQNARWREFEEEARRAGVPPGWLRR